jgi:hypothetical protein
MNTEAGAIDDHEVQRKVEKYDGKEFVKTLTEKDTNLSKAGYKTIGIAICEGKTRGDVNPVWRFVGLLPMLDPPRADSITVFASSLSARNMGWIIIFKLGTLLLVDFGKIWFRRVLNDEPGDIILNPFSPIMFSSKSNRCDRRIGGAPFVFSRVRFIHRYCTSAMLRLSSMLAAQSYK